ncbi:hypothetical protein ES703_53683 [subsurface metagenome]
MGKKEKKKKKKSGTRVDHPCTAGVGRGWFLEPITILRPLQTPIDAP